MPLLLILRFFLDIKLHLVKFVDANVNGGIWENNQNEEKDKRESDCWDHKEVLKMQNVQKVNGRRKVEEIFLLLVLLDPCYENRKCRAGWEVNKITVKILFWFELKDEICFGLHAFILFCFDPRIFFICSTIKNMILFGFCVIPFEVWLLTWIQATQTCSHVKFLELYDMIRHIIYVVSCHIIFLWKF